MRSLPGKAIPAEGQDVESTAGAQRTGKPKPPGQHGSPQLFSSLFQPWPGLQEVLDASRNKGHASQSREGAQGDSLFTQDHALSDSRHQLGPLLQKIPSAPLRDQNLPSATREQLSPRSCASLPARIRRQPPPGILSEAQIFPQGGTVLFITDCLHVCGPGNPATTRAQIALGTRAGVLW